MGLRVREPVERGRLLHPPAAQEDRPALRDHERRDGPGLRVPTQGGQGTLTRLPVKLRVTLVFAAVMGAVLAATGAFLYLRLESDLTGSIDDDLQSRSQQVIREMRVVNTGIGEAARSLLDARPDEFAQVL